MKSGLNQRDRAKSDASPIKIFVKTMTFCVSGAVLFANAVIWHDPDAGGANAHMRRAKMAWVRIAPCLFVAFAPPVLASGVFSHPSSELRRCGLLLLFERTSAGAGCSCCSNGRAIRTAGCSLDEHRGFGRRRAVPDLPRLKCRASVVVVVVLWWCVTVLP